MSSLFTPSEAYGDGSEEALRVALVAAHGQLASEIRRALERAGHEVVQTDAESAAASVRAAWAGTPPCVILVDEPPSFAPGSAQIVPELAAIVAGELVAPGSPGGSRAARSAGGARELLTAWAAEGLLDRCVVVVVVDGRGPRRAALRAGALACVDRRSLNPDGDVEGVDASLIGALEDAVDRFAAARSTAGQVSGSAERAGGWNDAGDLDLLWWQIEERMGFCPNLFRLSPHQPAITRGLYALAEFAYLDNPIPALLKEQLYVYLSKFCHIPYCLELHTAILLGRGQGVGGGSCTLEEVRELLEEPAPDADALARSLAALEQLEGPVQHWPRWDSELGYHLRLACAQVFLRTHRAHRWLFALQRSLGPARHEQLMLFLAFIRVGHFWAELHPELEPDAALEPLVHGDQALAASLAVAARESAAQIGASGPIQAELDKLRARVEHGEQLRELADSIPAFIAYVDAEQRYVFVNHSYVERFDRPAKDIVGRRVEEVMGAANYEGIRAKLEAALQGETVRFEASITTPPTAANPRASTREHDIAYLPDRRGDGTIAGCFVLVTDVTAHKQAEHLTQRVLDTLFTIVTILDVDGTLLEANATPLALAGISIDEVRGRKFWDCYWWGNSPEIQLKLREACERAAQGEVVREDIPVLIPEGMVMTMDFQVAPIYDADGRVTHLIPSAVDITHRARAQQQLRQSEERSRLAQRAGQVGVWEHDSATGVTFWSDSMWAIYGYEPSPGVDPDTLFRARLHPEDARRVVAWLEAMLAGEQGPRLVFRVVRSDQQVRWVEATATVTRTGVGESSSVRMVGVNIDITERKQAERILRESEERLRMAKDAANLGIYDYDVRAGTIRWDERARELWEVGVDEPVGYVSLMANLHPDDRGAVAAAVERALDPRGDGTFLVEYRIIGRVSGAVRWAAASGQATFDDGEDGEDGEAVRLVGTIQDITARKQAEEALRESQAQLREADQRKDEFLAMLGHELRNPLAAIRSGSELLQIFASEDHRLRRVHEVLERQSNHMVRLIDGLLEVSRIARGKILLECKSVDLCEVLEGVIVDRSDQIASSGLSLDIQVLPGPVWVWGDDVRLAQIFDNLIGNAMKFTAPPGTLRVALRVEGDAAVVLFEDTGVGIHAEMLSSIFDAFQQGKQGIARRAGGLGLGLALVKGLVELHEGRVEARSAGPGMGAEFEVRLPLGAQAEAHHVTSLGLSAERGQQRVLIIEDNADAAQMLLELLRLRGHAVTTADSGPQSLELLAKGRADIVLCDIGLPGMSGYEVARAIRANVELRDIQLVALTGHGQPGDRELAVEAGFDDHLVKPVDLQALERLLSRLPPVKT